MAISVIAATEATSTGATNSINITAPAGLQTGSVLLAFIAGNNGESLTPPSGWSAANLSSTSDGLRIYQKTSVTSADSEQTFTWTATGSLTWITSVLATSPGVALLSTRSTLTFSSLFDITPATQTADSLSELGILVAWSEQSNSTQSAPTGTKWTGSGESKLMGVYQALEVDDVTSGAFSFGAGSATNNRLVAYSFRIVETVGYPAAPVFIGSTGTDTGGFAETSIALTAPAGVVDGSLLFAVFALRFSDTISGPAGWTLEQTVDIAEDGGSFRLERWAKTTVTSADASQTFTWTVDADGTSEASGVIFGTGTSGAELAEVLTYSSLEVSANAVPVPTGLDALGDDELFVVLGTARTFSTTGTRQPLGTTRFTGSSLRRLIGGYRYRKATEKQGGLFFFNNTDEWQAGSIALRFVVAEASNDARILAPSPLGSPALLLYNNFDPTYALDGLQSRYVCDVTTPSGVLRVPISSWQATLQVDAASYVQCVIPGVATLVDQLTPATQFSVRKITTINGIDIEQVIATAPAQTLSFAQGQQRYTLTMSGYADALFTSNDNPDPLYDRTLRGVRQVFQTFGGGQRARCSIDWLLRPGQRAYIGDSPILVDYINYYVTSAGDAYMDVGERAGTIP